MALTICKKCKLEWQAMSGTEPCPRCAADAALARAEKAEAELAAFNKDGLTIAYMSGHASGKERMRAEMATLSQHIQVLREALAFYANISSWMPGIENGYKNQSEGQIGFVAQYTTPPAIADRGDIAHKALAETEKT